MASNYGIVNTIKPPVLDDVLQPSLITFEVEYSKYKRKVDSINAERDDEHQITIATVRDCMCAEILHALCIIGKIPGATTVEEATAEQVQHWFDAALGMSTQPLPERMKSAVGSVKYEHNSLDAAGSALKFIISVVTALDKQNCSDIIQDVDQCKVLIDELVNKVQPDFLRKRIREERRLWSNAQKGSISYFQENLSKLAAEVQRNESLRPGKKQKFSESAKDISDVAGSGSDSKKKGKPDAHSDSKPKSGKRKSSAEWTKPCLNPDCTEIHRLKDCTNTTAEKKRELFDELYSKSKKQKNVKSIKDCGSTIDEPAHQPSTPDSAEGRYSISIEDCVTSIALGDYGADVSAIGLSMFKQVEDLSLDVPVKIFEDPVILEGAFGNGSGHVTANKSIRLSVTITLPGPNLHLRIRGVEFFVVDQDMTEVILGRPVLKALGFNLNEHLEKVHSMVHDKDVSELEQNGGKLFALSYSGLAYQSVDDDPIKLPDTVGAGIGKDSKESIDKAFRKIIGEVSIEGMSSIGISTLTEMMTRFRDVFRIKLGPDPPAKVEPLVITRADNTLPYRSPQRRYAPLQRDFIVRTIKELEEVGAIYKNPKARWASPALAVTKPGSHKLRFTVDLRGPNARTVPIQSSMPHLESHFQDIAGSTCFANLDLAHGYWQVPLSEESQEMMSIQTPIGVYSSRRLLQGGCDSGSHFQAVIRDKLDGRVNNVLQWLDDFLFFAKNEQELLNNLHSFFEVCNEVGIKIHAEKSHLFVKEAKFCGRIISADGIQFNPRHFDILLGMSKPTKADELQQLVCATNWMRNSIPEYSKTIAPLHQLLEDAYTKAGKRTKQAVSKISLANEWGATHDAAFTRIKSQLAASVKLAHPKPDHTMCLFTDASDSHWGAVLTQVPDAHRRRTLEEQHHEPLSFLSGAFKGSSANWSVPEKEGFAIVESMCRLDYLVYGHTVSIFTDHANLVYIYDPYGKNPGISRHTASKLMRWAIKLSAFRFVIEYLPGERNVWADLLTRWAVQPNTVVKANGIKYLKSIMLAPVSPENHSTLDWPTREDIILVQNSTKQSPPRTFKKTTDGWMNDNGVLWLPSDECRLSSPNSTNENTTASSYNLSNLKLRILIAAHSGLGGHRGSKVTKASIKAHFFWEKMDSDVDNFVKSCLHCLCTAAGEVVPRPLGHALHGSRPNEMLHFDFCYMSKGENGIQYVLVLKDDHSGYVWLLPAESADSETALSALIQWFSTFGVAGKWVSDRGTHFKNELVRQISTALKCSHHFTLAYCPWSNGTVEVVCRELLRASRALLSEFQLPQHCWPSVLPIVQLALNSSKLERLGNRCPLLVFTSHEPSTPLASITQRSGPTSRVHTIELVRAQQRINIEKVQASLENMHRDVLERSTKRRTQAVAAHNRKTNVRPINFDVGDFVLRGVLHRERGKKPSLRWKGPFRVVACKSEYIFQVEDLLTAKRQDVHGRRLKFFQNKYYEVTEELKDHLAYQQNELLVVDKLEDIRCKNGVAEVYVKWKGFSSEENDWVLYDALKEDVPVLIEEFIDDIESNGTARQRKVVSSL